MKWSPFRIRVPGKWVLAGEHSVLRGAAAVALPHPELGLELEFEPREGSGLVVEPGDAESLIREVLAGVGVVEVPGRLEIKSTIPVGAGFGSSAALCVAITRWLSEPLQVAEERWTEFATELEHRFHGQSSGMDVAVIAAATPIVFLRGMGATPLGVRSLPRFTFHDTGLRARTSECVAKVERFLQAQPIEAARIDEQMAQASRDAAEGLRRYDSGDTSGGLQQIAGAMELAQGCFVHWDLVPPVAQEVQKRLIGQGALGAKLTGAGGGGMIVALWN